MFLSALTTWSGRRSCCGAPGVPVLREPWDASNGQRVAYVTDPAGNRVHLYA